MRDLSGAKEKKELVGVLSVEWSGERERGRGGKRRGAGRTPWPFSFCMLDGEEGVLFVYCIGFLVLVDSGVAGIWSSRRG